MHRPRAFLSALPACFPLEEHLCIAFSMHLPISFLSLSRTSPHVFCSILDHFVCISTSSAASSSFFPQVPLPRSSDARFASYRVFAGCTSLHLRLRACLVALFSQIVCVCRFLTFAHAYPHSLLVIDSRLIVHSAFIRFLRLNLMRCFSVFCLLFRLCLNRFLVASASFHLCVTSFSSFVLHSPLLCTRFLIHFVLFRVHFAFSPLLRFSTRFSLLLHVFILVCYRFCIFVLVCFCFLRGLASIAFSRFILPRFHRPPRFCTRVDLFFLRSLLPRCLFCRLVLVLHFRHRRCVRASSSSRLDVILHTPFISRPLSRGGCFLSGTSSLPRHVVCILRFSFASSRFFVLRFIFTPRCHSFSSCTSACARFRWVHLIFVTAYLHRILWALSFPHFRDAFLLVGWVHLGGGLRLHLLHSATSRFPHVIYTSASPLHATPAPRAISAPLFLSFGAGTYRDPLSRLVLNLSGTAFFAFCVLE